MDEKSFLAFPLHDATFQSLLITPASDGDVTVTLKVETNEQESFGAPLKSRNVTFTFEDCRRVQQTIPGFNSSKKFILTWEVIQNSPVIEELKQKGFLVSGLTHYQFDLSDGSQIDIVAQRVFLTTP